MTRNVVVFAIWGSFVAGAVSAQSPPPRTGGVASLYLDPMAGLSLEQAIERALGREPGLRAARADIEAARGMVIQAGLRPNPTLSAEQRYEPSGTDRQFTVGMEWPLDLFRRPGRVVVAERELEAVEQSVADRERMLTAEVRMQMGEALVAIQELTITDELLSVAKRSQELLSRRTEEGAAPPIERDLMEVDLRRLEAERITQAGHVDHALIALKRLLGFAPETPLKLRDSLETVVLRASQTADLAHDASVGEVDRADVREAQAQVRLADARIDRMQREGRVDASLFASYMRMDTGFPQRGFGTGGAVERVRGQFNYAVAGVSILMPLRNRNQGAIAAARAERAAAEARVEAAQLTAHAEVASARTREAHAHQAIGLYTTSARPLGRRNLDVVAETFELGRATIFDVVAEQRHYLELERAYVAALREAFEARTDLERALGARP